MRRFEQLLGVATCVLLSGETALATVHVAEAKQSTEIKMWFEQRPGETHAISQIVTPTTGYAFAHMYSIQTGNVDPQLHCVSYDGETGSPVLRAYAYPAHAYAGFAQMLSAPFSDYPDYCNRLTWGSLTEAVGSTYPLLLAEASGAAGAMGYEITGSVSLIIRVEGEVSVFNGDVPSYGINIWLGCPADEAEELSNSGEVSYSVVEIVAGDQTMVLGTMAGEDESYEFFGYDSVDDESDPKTGTFETSIDFDNGDTPSVGVTAFSVNQEAVDLDSNDTIDCDDLLLLRQAVSAGGGSLTDAESVANYDFDGSGAVDSADLLVLRVFIDKVLNACTTGDSGDDGILDPCDLYALRDIISGGSVDDSDGSYVVSLDMDLDGDLDSTDETLLTDLLLDQEIYQDGDVDLNYYVDIYDFGILAGNLGMSPATRTDGDLDGDNDVDIFDFGILTANFGIGGAPCE